MPHNNKIRYKMYRYHLDWSSRGDLILPNWYIILSTSTVQRKVTRVGLAAKVTISTLVARLEYG
jgi:hypothetical protein